MRYFLLSTFGFATAYLSLPVFDLYHCLIFQLFPALCRQPVPLEAALGFIGHRVFYDVLSHQILENNLELPRNPFLSKVRRYI
jgi:hypothetical protein